MSDDLLNEKQSKEQKHKLIEEELCPIEHFALETKIRQLIQEFLNI